MKSKAIRACHIDHALKNATHPISPHEMATVVNGYVWAGERPVAYWLAEEMVAHPAIRSGDHDRWSGYTHDYWRGVWQTLAGIVTRKQSAKLPPGAVERQEREREKRKRDLAEHNAQRNALMVALAAVVLAFAGCTDDEPAPLPSCVDLGAPDSLFCTAGGVCTWEGVECCIEPAPGRPRDERCEAQP